MKKIFLFLIAMASTTALLSETTYTLNTKAYSPSIATPEPASFIKYGDIPVSEYTGTPDISIPVYTIKEGDINLPITLRYHASGIKVEEQASCVGLGWNLDAGGVITRAIIGREDGTNPWIDFTKALFVNAPKLAKEPYVKAETDKWWLDMGVAQDFDPYFNGMNTYMDAVAGHFQPDLYNFSFLNYSGQFYCDMRDNSYHLINDKSNLKFNTSPGGYKAVNTEGVIFYFTTEETLYTNATNQGVSSRSFYLTKIVYPNQQVVDFIYKIGTTQVTLPLRDTETVEVTPYYTTKSIGTNMTYYPVILDKIKTANVLISFQTSYDRNDLPGERRLNTIQVIDGMGKICHTYSFGFDYFKSTLATESVKNNYVMPRDLLRLKLTAFTADMQPYTFKYNPIQLPSKRSVSIDYWGYYNGATNSISGNPTANPISYSYSTLPDIEPLLNYDAVYLRNFASRDYRGVGVGASRGTVPEKMKACMLEMIEYPTGGTTEYVFEPHTFSNQTIIDGVTAKAGASASVAGHNNSIRTVSNSFTITYNVIASVYAGLTVSNQFNLSLTSQQLREKIACGYVKLIKDGVVIFSILASDLPYKDHSTGYISYYSYSSADIDPDSSIKPNFDLKLTPGTYTVEAYLPSICTEISSGATISLNFYPKNKWSTGGGLRIAKIISKPIKDKLEQTVTKSYVYEDGNQSYGKIMAPLRLYREDNVVNASFLMSFGKVGICSVLRTYITGWILSDQSSIDMSGDSNGCLVGYDKVTILENGNTSNGKIEKFFRNTVPIQYSGLSFLTIPSVPYLDNGLVDKEVVYNDASDKVKESIYNYKNYGLYNAPYFGVVGSDNWIGPLNLNCPNLKISPNYAHYDGRYNVQMYAIRSESWRLSELETTDFLPSGSVSTKKHVAYNSCGSISTESLTLKSGKKLSTSYKYPCSSDYNLSYPIISDGVNTPAEIIKTMAQTMGMTSYPVEVISKEEINGSEYVIGGNLFLYGNKYKAENVFSLELSSPILATNFSSTIANNSGSQCSNITNGVLSYSSLYNEKQKMQYGANSNVSNIFDYQKGFSTSYIWGYNNTYPTAKIENGSVSQVAYTSFESGVQDGWNITLSMISNVSPAMKTGNNGYLLTSKSIVSSTLPAGEYWVEFYGYSATTAGNIIINGNINQAIDANKYQFYKVKCTKSTAGGISIAGGNTTLYIDEVRIYPTAAQMTSYTYTPLVGMSSQTDANGITTYYEYDWLGRLTCIKDNDGKILKQNYYHYKDAVAN